MSSQMTRNELNQKLCAVITTLNEVEFAPEVSLYLGLGSNLEQWKVVKNVLMLGRLAIENGDYSLSITSAGRQMAAEINAIGLH